MEKINRQLEDLGFGEVCSYIKYYRKTYPLFVMTIYVNVNKLTSVVIQEHDTVVDRERHFINIMKNPSIEKIEKLNSILE